MEQENNTDKKNIEFDSMNLLLALMRHKFVIIGITLGGIIISVIISLIMPNWYKSSASVVPPKSSESLLEGALGSISSALKNFGLTRLGKQGSESGYSYMVILESRTLKDSLIEKFNLAEEYDIPDTLPSLILKELENNLSVTSETEGNFIIACSSKDPVKAKRMVEYYVEKANEFTLQLYYKEAKYNLEYAEQRFEMTDSALTAVTEKLRTFSKKHQIFSPLDQATAAAKALGELKAEKFRQEMIYEMTANRFGEEDPYAKQQKKIVEGISSKLQEAEKQPGFAGDFALEDAPDIGIEYLRLYSLFEAYSQLKAFLLPVVEENRLAEKRVSRTFFYVDQPQVPDKKSRPRRSFIVAGTALGSFIISVLFVLSMYGVENLRKRYKEALNTKPEK